MHERATAGALVPEPDRLGCATIVCERPAGNRTTTRQFRLWHRVATGRLAPCRQPWGHTPGCNRGRFWLPLPMSVGPDFRRECGARRSRAPTVTQGKKRSATAPHPLDRPFSGPMGEAYNRYGSLCQGKVVEFIDNPTRAISWTYGLQPTPRKGSGAPRKARGDGKVGVESRLSAYSDDGRS